MVDLKTISTGRLIQCVMAQDQIQRADHPQACSELDEWRAVHGITLEAIEEELEVRHKRSIQELAKQADVLGAQMDFLGDGVYAEVDGDMIKLTTNDGIRATNTIYLEPEVYARLVEYAKRVYWGGNR